LGQALPTRCRIASETPPSIADFIAKRTTRRKRLRSIAHGRSKHWIKIKNPNSPAMQRAAEVDWSGTDRPQKITFAEMREQGVRVPIAPQYFHIFEAQWCRTGDQSIGGTSP
jgi:hypothetical protein